MICFIHLAATGTQNTCHQLKPNSPLLATSPQANLGNSFYQTSCSAFPLQRCTVEMLKHCPCPQNKTHLAVKLAQVCSATQKLLPDAGERTLKPALGYLYGAPDLTKPKPSMPDQLALLTTATTSSTIQSQIFFTGQRCSVLAPTGILPP